MYLVNCAIYLQRNLSTCKIWEGILCLPEACLSAACSFKFLLCINFLGLAADDQDDQISPTLTIRSLAPVHKTTTYFDTEGDPENKILQISIAREDKVISLSQDMKEQLTHCEDRRVVKNNPNGCNGINLMESVVVGIRCSAVGRVVTFTVPQYPLPGYVPKISRTILMLFKCIWCLFILSGRDESEDINMREMSLNDHICRASAHRSLNISEITEQESSVLRPTWYQIRRVRTSMPAQRKGIQHRSTIHTTKHDLKKPWRAFIQKCIRTLLLLLRLAGYCGVINFVYISCT